MITYKVYQFVNRVTGLSYVGITKRSLEQRKAEHMLLAKENSQRKLARSVQQYPLDDQWDINTLYMTPIRVEAVMMEAAFIRVLHAVDNGYNSTCGDVDSLCNAVAHSIVTGMEVLKYPFERKQHGDYPDVIMFKFYNDDTWCFGYHTGKDWVMYHTEYSNPDDVWKRVNSHFENFDVPAMEHYEEPEFEDETKELTPLKALAGIQEIINETHFCTEEDVNNFFLVLNGMKVTTV